MIASFLPEKCSSSPIVHSRSHAGSPHAHWLVGGQLGVSYSIPQFLASSKRPTRRNLLLPLGFSHDVGTVQRAMAAATEDNAQHPARAPASRTSASRFRTWSRGIYSANTFTTPVHWFSANRKYANSVITPGYKYIMCDYAFNVARLRAGRCVVSALLGRAANTSATRR